jgi:Protein of unknown function (DUF2867)
MSVVECEIPSGSALRGDLLERADFHDAYRAPTHLPGLDVVDLFFAIFANRPAWMNLMLVARNKAAALGGLEAPGTWEIFYVKRKAHYAIGEKIGPWPIFFLGTDELIAGRDNKHMDFRLSVMKVGDGNRTGVIASTVCTVNDRFGRYYLSSVIPFHKFGIRKLMANAVAAQRL